MTEQQKELQQLQKKIVRPSSASSLSDKEVLPSIKAKPEQKKKKKTGLHIFSNLDTTYIHIEKMLLILTEVMSLLILIAAPVKMSATSNADIPSVPSPPTLPPIPQSAQQEGYKMGT